MSAIQENIGMGELLLGYSDEVPPYNVSGSGKYKVRNAFWQALKCWMELAEISLQEISALPVQLHADIASFNVKYGGRDFSRRLKTADDIAAANGIIGTLMTELRKHVSGTMEAS